MSLRSKLVMSCIKRLRRSSNFARELWPTDGEHLENEELTGALNMTSNVSEHLES